MGDSEKDRATIGEEVIDSIRNGNADRVRAEVMIVDEDRRSTPSGSWILEVAHEFTLLGIYADDGIMPTLERSSEMYSNC